jgi:hypothetical protein
MPHLPLPPLPPLPLLPLHLLKKHPFSLFFE